MLINQTVLLHGEIFVFLAHCQVQVWAQPGLQAWPGLQQVQILCLWVFNFLS